MEDSIFDDMRRQDRLKKPKNYEAAEIRKDKKKYKEILNNEKVKGFGKFLRSNKRPPASRAKGVLRVLR